MTSMHQLVGGRRVVQVLGPIPPQLIGWHGILLGADAFARAREMDSLRVGGVEQTMIYGPWNWRVVVKRWVAPAEHQFRIPYEISVLPIEDLTQSIAAPKVSNESLFKQAGLTAQ